MSEQELPTRPKENEAPAEAAADGEKGPSKSALKKAAKEKEKAEKKARLAAEEAARKKADEANDVSKEDYGELPMVRETTGPKYETFLDLAAEYDGKDFKSADAPKVVFRATVLNARNQSAKLSFLTFAQQEQVRTIATNGYCYVCELLLTSSFFDLTDHSSCRGGKRDSQQANGQIRGQHTHIE